MTTLEHVLLRAYLKGNLNREESEAFELLMMERPDIAEWVDADTALSLGLADAGPASLAHSATAGQTATGDRKGADSGTSKDDSTIIPFPKRPPLPYLAAAASLLLAVGLGAGVLLRPTPSPLGAAELMYVDKTRNLSTIPKVVIAPNRALVLLVPVANVGPCVADIELRQAGSEPLRAQAKPDEFGYASLVLDSGGLKPGRAEVSVRCGADAPAEYPIDVELPTSDY